MSTFRNYQDFETSQRVDNKIKKTNKKKTEKEIQIETSFFFH